MYLGIKVTKPLHIIWDVAKHMEPDCKLTELVVITKKVFWKTFSWNIDVLVDEATKDGRSSDSDE